MKNRSFPRSLLVIVAITLLAVFAIGAAAQDPPTVTTPPPAAETAALTQNAPVQLSYGVPEILKLVNAKVGDETIVAFVGSSGRIYNLGASEIVYLREQGVSDPVITAMLNQHKKVPKAPSVAATPPPAVNSETSGGAAAPAATQPSTTSIQTAPAVPSPPVYVVPTPAPVYRYYDAYPYYGYPYYGYAYPRMSFSFGFGNYYYRGGHYHGGGHHHGGGGYYHRGGGNHGGGGHHGGGSRGGHR